MTKLKESLDKACNIMGFTFTGPHYFTRHALEWLAEKQPILITKVAHENWRVGYAGVSASYETLNDALAMAVIVCRKRELETTK